MAQKKKMSVTQLTIVTAVNMMGSGIIMLPTNLAQVGYNVNPFMDCDNSWSSNACFHLC